MVASVSGSTVPLGTTEMHLVWSLYGHRSHGCWVELLCHGMLLGRERQAGHGAIQRQAQKCVDKDVAKWKRHSELT